MSVGAALTLLAGAFVRVTAGGTTAAAAGVGLTTGELSGE